MANDATAWATIVATLWVLAGAVLMLTWRVSAWKTSIEYRLTRIEGRLPDPGPNGKAGQPAPARPGG